MIRADLRALAQPQYEPAPAQTPRAVRVPEATSCYVEFPCKGGGKIGYTIRGYTDDGVVVYDPHVRQGRADGDV